MVLSVEGSAERAAMGSTTNRPCCQRRRPSEAEALRMSLLTEDRPARKLSMWKTLAQSDSATTPDQKIDSRSPRLGSP